MELSSFKTFFRAVCYFTVHSFYTRPFPAGTSNARLLPVQRVAPPPLPPHHHSVTTTTVLIIPLHLQSIMKKFVISSMEKRRFAGFLAPDEFVVQ